MAEYMSKEYVREIIQRFLSDSPDLNLFESLGELIDANRWGHDISEAIPKVFECLGGNKPLYSMEDEEVCVAYRAAYLLGEFAEKGGDVTPVVSRLTKLFRDDRTSDEAKGCLIKAACNKKSRKATLKALIEVWNWGRGIDKGDASYVLRITAEKGINISVAVPKLAELLQHRDERARGAALKTLKAAVENGTDVSKAEKALENGLENDSRCWREITTVLVKHYIVTKNWEKIEELTTYFYGLHLATALMNAADDLVDITPAIPVLERMLSSEMHTGITKREAVRAMASNCMNKEEWEKVDGLADVEYGSGVVYALKEAVKAGRNVSGGIRILVKKLEDKKSKDDAMEALEIAVEKGFVKIDDVNELRRRMNAIVKGIDDKAERVKIKKRLASLYNAAIEKIGEPVGLKKLRTSKIPKRRKGAWRTGMKKRVRN